jgi:hypothetical protein
MNLRKCHNDFHYLLQLIYTKRESPTVQWSQKPSVSSSGPSILVLEAVEVYHRVQS